MGGPWKCPACDEGFMSWALLLNHATTLGHTAYSRRDQQRAASTPYKSHDQSNEKIGTDNRTDGTSRGSVNGSAPSSAVDLDATCTGTASALAEPNPLCAWPPDNQHPPDFGCSICNLLFSSAIALDAHYKASVVHPSCGSCGRGVLDKAELSTVSRRNSMAR